MSPMGTAMEALSSSEPLALVSGSLVPGGFRVERMYHASATSRLYEVRHAVLGYRAMLKVAWGGEPDAIRDEVQALLALEHPCSPRVLYAGQLSSGEGTPSFFVREHATGRPLSAVIRMRRRLDPMRAVQLTLNVLGVLQEAHDKGLIHGDIKPDNIIVNRVSQGWDLIKVIDFGASRPTKRSRVRGTTSKVFATPRYAPPEVLEGSIPDIRADLYSLGVVLYECIAGVRPDQASDAGDAPGPGRLGVTPPPLAQVVPTSEQLSRIVARATDVNPDRRYQSAADFIAALGGLDCAELVEFGGLGGESSNYEQETLDTVEITEAATGGRRGSNSPTWRGDHSLLLSNGVPVLWVLGGDPATDHSTLKEAILSVTARYDIRWLDAGARTSALQALRAGTSLSPWVVIFGDLHVLLQDELILECRSLGETSRLLVSTHGNFELLTSTVNSCGLHSQICLPATSEEIEEQVENMVVRARRQRQRFDRLRLALRDARTDIQTLRRRLGDE